VKNLAKILIKTLLWAILSLLGLFLIVFMLLQIPRVQNVLTSRAVNFVHNKTQTEVQLERIDISFPKTVLLRNIYVEDLQEDTLLYCSRLSIDIDMLALLKDQIQLNQIEFNDLVSNVHRKPDKSFNFSFIVNAFNDTTKKKRAKRHKNPWNFDIKEIHFEHSSLSYTDDVSKLNAGLEIGNLLVVTDVFRLDTFQIHFENILVENTSGRLIVSGDSKPNTASAKQIPDIGFTEIKLRNVAFNLKNTTNGQKHAFDVAEAAIEADDINLPGRAISLQDVTLRDSYAYMFTGNANSENNNSTSADLSLDLGWTISLSQLEVSNSAFRIDQNNFSPTPGLVDFEHLHLNALNSKMGQIKLDDTGIRLDIQDLSFEERSGLDVNELSAKVDINEQSTTISDLLIRTDQSNISLNLQGQYPGFEAIRGSPETIQFDLGIDDSKISFADLQRFTVNISENIPLKINNTTSLSFSAKANGDVADISIQELAFLIGQETEITINGALAGLPNTKTLQFDLNSRIKSSAADLNLFLPDTTFESITLPERIELTSQFEGELSDFESKHDLKSTLGNLLAEVDLSGTDRSVPEYEADIYLEDFDLGKLTQDTAKFGTMTLNLKGKGSGFELEQMKGHYDLQIEHLTFNSYNYKDLHVASDISEQRITIDSKFEDPNLAFIIDGSIDYKKPDRYYDLEVDLEKAYLRNLHLTSEELKMQALVDVDLNIGSLRRINGDLKIKDFGIYKNEALYRVDSFLIASVNQEKKMSLNVHSDIMEAEFKGNISILDLGKTLKQHFNEYYTLPSTSAEITHKQNFDFFINIRNTDLMTEVLFPKLSKFDPGRIEGSYTSADKKLDVLFKIPMVGYNKAVLDSMVLMVKSDRDKLDYELSIAEVHDSIFHINQLILNGEIMNDTLSTRIIMHDSLSKDKYRFGGRLVSTDSAYSFQFLQEDLIINYEKWQLPENHFLQFGESGFNARNFSISNKQQQLTLKTENRNLHILFDQFQLEALSGLVEGQKRIFEGILNGEILLRDTTEFTSISADLIMNDVSVREEAIGKIEILLQNKTQGKYDGKIQVSGPANQLEARGYYDAVSDVPEMNVDLSIQQLGLATIEVFAGQEISQSEGYLSGSINTSGTLLQPEISGELTFKEAVFEVDYLGTKVHVDEQSFQFKDGLVNINNFVLRDVDDQPFRIDGSINIEDLLNPVMDLNVSSDDFLALNTTVEDNDLYYGKLILDSETTLKGPLEELDIFVKVNIGEGSELTYVVPSAQKGVMERKDIMRFVDKDQEEDAFLNLVHEQRQPGDTLQAPLGLDINAIINIDRNSSLAIVIDPVAGDKLQLSGNANLSLGINPAGDVSLTGQYEIYNGLYVFSFYGIVKKEFDVRKGSNLKWFGDVLDAEVDVTAGYAVEAAPIDLMQSQASESTESSIYNQKLPFTVELSMQGKLLKPDISFQLGIEDRAKSYAGGAVYGKIQSINQVESEVNKQVFALLILNRFMANNPFASAGGTTEGLVRTSVSRLLSEQLNKLTDQIQGLDINVGLKSYEDFSMGERQGRTDLNLGLSTDILNDRVTVKVAGNITLEGTQQEQKDLSDIAGDVSLEYKLTEDGRFRIVTFRKEVYEALLQGEIIETGAGFILVEDFDKFGEIFQRRDNKAKKADE